MKFSFLNIKVCLFIAALATNSLKPAWSSDYYDAQTNAIKLREVAVGESVYKHVNVRLSQVLAVAQGTPQAAFSSFSPSSGVLTIPYIRVGSSSFANVAVTINEVISVGAEVRSYTPMPSSETFGEFKAAVLAAWRETPRYMDSESYQAQLRRIETSNTCYGFTSEDIIPTPRPSLNWGAGVHIPTLYPMRSTSYDLIYERQRSFPEPFIRVNLDANTYAQTDERVSQLRQALVDALIKLSTATPSMTARDQLKSTLLAYANANALSEGLLTNWSTTITPNTPVHFEVMPLTLNLIHAFNHVVQMLSPAERQVVGDWLHRLVSRVIASSWGSGKQDNKAYFRSQIGLAWGLITGDSSLVRNAILNFKHAIHEMRTDGSFINESSRGGSANLYQSQATDSVLSIAVALEENLGLPALSFQINGKSAWTAADRVVDAYFNQVGIASQYGKSCEQGSFGTVANPDPRWGSLQSISFLRVALKRDGLGTAPIRIRALSWEAYYYPEREGIDLISVLGN